MTFTLASVLTGSVDIFAITVGKFQPNCRLRSETHHTSRQSYNLNLTFGLFGFLFWRGE